MPDDARYQRGRAKLKQMLGELGEQAVENIARSPRTWLTTLSNSFSVIFIADRASTSKRGKSPRSSRSSRAAASSRNSARIFMAR